MTNDAFNYHIFHHHLVEGSGSDKLRWIIGSRRLYAHGNDFFSPDKLYDLEPKDNQSEKEKKEAGTRFNYWDRSAGTSSCGWFDILTDMIGALIDFLHLKRWILLKEWPDLVPSWLNLGVRSFIRDVCLGGQFLLKSRWTLKSGHRVKLPSIHRA